MPQFSHRAHTARNPRHALPFRPHALAAGLLLVLAAPVQADDLSATDLDAVNVEGQRLPDYAAGASRGATRLDLSPRQTPQSVSTVTRTQMDDFGLDSVNEVLAAATGVNVEQIETDRTYYTARGFDIVNFQRDGLGLPLPYGIQKGDLDTALYERVEVLRGANGLTSATGNPSATINFVRKRPAAQAEGQARLTLGSWNGRRIDADASVPLGEDVRARAVAAWERGDSYLDRYERNKHVLYGVVEADLGPATRLTLGASLQKNKPRSPMWGALPLYYTDGTPTDYDVSSSTAADWAFWKNEDSRAFAQLEHQVGGDWVVRVALDYEKQRNDSELFYVYGTPDRATGTGLLSYPGDYSGGHRGYFGDLSAAGTFALGGRRHDMVLGASAAEFDLAETSLYTSDMAQHVPEPEGWDGRYPQPRYDDPDDWSDGSDWSFRQRNAYATVRWNLSDRFKLITGANRSRAETAGIGYGGESRDTRTSRTTPFAGAVLDVGRDLSLYASYGEIFNPQAETDIAQRPLGPLTGDNRELGLKGEWFDGGLNASLAAFRARQRNLADYAGWNPDNGQYYYVGQDADSEGYEFDIAGRLTPHWQLAGGFTHLRIEAPEGGQARTFVPRRVLRLATAVDVPRLQGLKLGATLKWQSAIHNREGVTGADGREVVVRQDAYALLGLMANYAFGDWQATLNLENLTDEKYISSLYWSPQGLHGAPRNVSASLAYRF